MRKAVAGYDNENGLRAEFHWRWLKVLPQTGRPPTQNSGPIRPLVGATETFFV